MSVPAGTGPVLRRLDGAARRGGAVQRDGTAWHGCAARGGAVRAGRRRRTWLRVAVGAVAALAVTACSATAASTGTSSGDTDGYTSADGTTVVYAAGQRPGPVELTGTTFDGASVDTAAWRGDVVVVNVWYAACPPCRAEAPDLATVAANNADRGLHVIGVNSVDDAATANSFASTFAVPYPSISDPGGTALAALTGVVPLNATPTTVVLDRTGKVYSRIVGQVDLATLRDMVHAAMDEGATATPTP